MFYISVNFKCTKKVDHILESSLEVQTFYDALFVIYQLSEIKDNIHPVPQFPCLSFYLSKFTMLSYAEFIKNNLKKNNYS